MAQHWRIRIVNERGSCVEGGFSTHEAAAARQDALKALYAAQPDLGCLTILETYTPTRPVRDKVLALMEGLRQKIGDTDPIVRLAQGLEATSLLAIYDALAESVHILSQKVYEEEGKY